METERQFKDKLSLLGKEKIHKSKKENPRDSLVASIMGNMVQICRHPAVDDGVEGVDKSPSLSKTESEDDEYSEEIVPEPVPVPVS